MSPIKKVKEIVFSKATEKMLAKLEAKNIAKGKTFQKGGRPKKTTEKAAAKQTIKKTTAKAAAKQTTKKTTEKAAAKQKGGRPKKTTKKPAANDTNRIEPEADAVAEVTESEAEVTQYDRRKFKLALQGKSVHDAISSDIRQIQGLGYGQGKMQTNQRPHSGMERTGIRPPSFYRHHRLQRREEKNRPSQGHAVG